MGRYPIHEEATRSALRMIGELPPDSVWSFFVCDNDDPVVPGTFNIYAPRSEWGSLALLLDLTVVVDRDEDFVIYRRGPIHVSLTENHNG